MASHLNPLLLVFTSRLAAPWGMSQGSSGGNDGSGGSGGSGGSRGSPYVDGSTAGTVLDLLKNKMTGKVDAGDMQRTALN